MTLFGYEFRLPFPLKASKRDNLDRYYLLKFLGFGIFLHRIHHDEDKGIFHNHPWSGFSFVFGSYYEQKLDGSYKEVFLFNWLSAKEFHRVEIPKPVWTLFFHFRRSNLWQVCDYNGKILGTEPWKDIGGKTSYV